MDKTEKTFSINLIVWRQKSRDIPGKMVRYKVYGIKHTMSFLDVLDKLNEQLLERGLQNIAFEANCREGTCGMCGLIINGQVHGPGQNAATCRLSMKNFNPGDTITVEPWRIKAFPIIKDLVVDKSALDRICALGFSALKPKAKANAVLYSEEALIAAGCTGCGACIAACPNGSAALFIAAKFAHLSLLPQSQAEQNRQVIQLVSAAQAEGFGPCCNNGICEQVCPRGIKKDLIAKMHRAYIKAVLSNTGKIV